MKRGAANRRRARSGARLSPLALLAAAVVGLLTPEPALAVFGFHYPDFNHTHGLDLVGSAVTSSCEEEGAEGESVQPGYVYQPGEHGRHPPEEVLGGLTSEVEDVALVTIDTDQGQDVSQLERDEAAFGHREGLFYGGYSQAPRKDCALRIRLTPSRSSRSGGLWRTEAVEVLQGFSTEFAFQLTDLSRTCTLVRDTGLSTTKYRSCAVHGGDGFAFVIHRDPAGPRALGKGGEHLGYGGLVHALAVEFDAWFNPDAGDLVEDHVALLSQGAEPLFARRENHIHFPMPTSLADGLVHSVRIVYHDHLQPELAPFMRPGPAARFFMTEGSEGYGLGTLGVWMDGAADPIAALPVNLGVLLGGGSGETYVGFTASTGRAWASQDITTWSFCESSDLGTCAT